MQKLVRDRGQENQEFQSFYQALACQSGFERIDQYLQHGSTTRLVHSVAVAYYSYRLARFSRLSFHWEELVRGALLHDYFLYDAQDGDPAHKWHWTRHPGIAAENAKEELDLTSIEEDNHPLPHVSSHGKASQIPGGAWWYPWWIRPALCTSFFSRRAPYSRLRDDMPFLRDSKTSMQPGLVILLPEMAGKGLPPVRDFTQLPLTGSFFLAIFPKVWYTDMSQTESVF